MGHHHIPICCCGFLLISVGDRVNIFGESSNMARIGTKLCQNAFQTIPNVSFFHAEKKFGEIFDQKCQFLLIWHGFGAPTAERTSKSACSSNFALERLIQRCVRPKNLRFGLVPAGNFNPGELNPGPVDGWIQDPHRQQSHDGRLPRALQSSPLEAPPTPVW